ncbi:hypothetical protein HK101_010420 [Irineochytrium annulatum]|nr:hypothetical protein HK101_010420 [Irineochytrium annulatum]
MLGLAPVLRLPASCRLLFLTRALRLLSYGAIGIVLVLYVKRLGLSDTALGLFLTVTLLGTALASLAVTAMADRVGRKRMLVMGASGMMVAGFGFACLPEGAGDGWGVGGWLGLVCMTALGVLGVISPSGYEVGPFPALEQSVISQFIPFAHRASAFAWYNLTASLSTAVGSLLAGRALAYLVDVRHIPHVDAYRLVVASYGAIAALLLVCFLCLGNDVEAHEDGAPHAAQCVAEVDEAAAGELAPLLDDGTVKKAGALELSDASRAIVFRLCCLLALDGFGAGMLSASLLAYWFHGKFGVDEAYLGSLLFVANLLAGISALVSGSISGRFGLINTMVFSHLPANMLMIMVPFMPDLFSATGLLFLRFSISQMDGVPRTAYIASIVPAHERTAVFGVTNIVRTVGSAFGPLVTGFLAERGLFDWAFVICGGVTIVYDLLMLWTFGKVKPLEER